MATRPSLHIVAALGLFNSLSWAIADASANFGTCDGLNGRAFIQRLTSHQRPQLASASASASASPPFVDAKAMPALGATLGVPSSPSDSAAPRPLSDVQFASKVAIGQGIDLAENSEAATAARAASQQGASAISPGEAMAARIAVEVLRRLPYSARRHDMPPAGHSTLSLLSKEEGDLVMDLFSIFQDMNLGIGTLAPLTQEGYVNVSSAKDPMQMEFYIRRLISDMGLRVRDQGGLRGIIPYYDGTLATQNLETLTGEIRKNLEQPQGWVTDQVSGASAPLTTDGYNRVATLTNHREMTEFVRRVASDLGLSVQEEGGLEGLAQWHSGEKDVQTFTDLRAELINASKEDSSWLSRGRPCPGTGHPDNQTLDRFQAQSERWNDKTTAVQNQGLVWDDFATAANSSGTAGAKAAAAVPPQAMVGSIVS